MADRETIYKDVREMLVDILSVEPEEVTPDATFFDDLHGESIEVLELSFRCNQRYGMTVPFQDLFKPLLVPPGESSDNSEDFAGRIAREFPYLTVTSDLDLTNTAQIQSLFTVDTIVQMIEHSLRKSGR